MPQDAVVRPQSSHFFVGIARKLLRLREVVESANLDHIID
jgi:hypothetical protein